MIDPKLGKVLFYPVVLIPGASGQGRSRPGPFRWLAPCDTPQQAQGELDRMIAERGASMGYVIEFPENGEPEIMVNRIRPGPVRTIIEKYVMLCDLIDDEHPLR